MNSLHAIFRRFAIYILAAGILLAGCGQYPSESTVSSKSSHVNNSENKPKPNHRKKLLVSGGIIVGGVAATCLFIVKTKKICRGLFRKHNKVEHNASEALATTKDIKKELKYLQASYGRLYEKHLELEKQTNVFLGRQANTNGMFLEYVSAKEVPLILKEMGIQVLETLQSVKGLYRSNDKNIVQFEIDAIFITKDSAYFLEAKTNLNKAQVDKFANHISHFNKAKFDHPQISEKLASKEAKGIITYVFDSKMSNMTSQQGKSASTYAHKTHGITTFHIFSWKEFKTLKNLTQDTSR